MQAGMKPVAVLALWVHTMQWLVQVHAQTVQPAPSSTEKLLSHAQSAARVLMQMCQDLPNATDATLANMQVSKARLAAMCVSTRGIQLKTLARQVPLTVLVKRTKYAWLTGDASNALLN